MLEILKILIDKWRKIKEKHKREMEEINTQIENIFLNMLDQPKSVEDISRTISENGDYKPYLDKLNGVVRKLLRLEKIKVYAVKIESPKKEINVYERI